MPLFSSKPPKQEDPSLIKRAMVARRQYANTSASQTNRKVGAAMALLAPSRINQMSNLLRTTLTKNEQVTNLRRLNNFVQKLKNSLPTRPGGPVISRNQVRNAAITAMSSYIAQKIGFKTNANTMLINDLLVKLIKLKMLIETAPNQSTRREYGAELGRILGKLVMAYTQVMKGQKINNRKVNIGKGALRGFLNQTVGAPVSMSVMATIEGVEGFHKFTGGLRF
jgi:hypothetical protein